MLKPVLLAAIFACTAAPGFAAQTTYQINKDHTDVVFTVNHIGYTMKHGWFRDISGTLLIDTLAPEGAKLEVTIKSGSVDTNHAQRDKDISKPGWFDVAQFPDIRFVSTKVTRLGADAADVTGNLTLHGVTHPLVLHVKLNKAAPSPFGQQPTLGFTATGSLKRSDYGMTQLLPIIGDQVDIVIDSELSASK